jgi:hypothetical protein
MNGIRFGIVERRLIEPRQVLTELLEAGVANQLVAQQGMSTGRAINVISEFPRLELDARRP